MVPLRKKVLQYGTPKPRFYGTRVSGGFSGVELTVCRVYAIRLETSDSGGSGVLI